MALQNQTYQSVTIWQGDRNWEIEVRVGEFSTPTKAAEFGDFQARNLKHEPNADYLTLIDASGHCHQIKNEQVIVRQLKPKSRKKLVVNIDDFVVVKLEIKDFSRIDGLNTGFDCLAYGVVDNPNRN